MRVRVSGGGREHHAVELGDVGGEAVHHAADLIHQRALRPPGLIVHGNQAPIVPDHNGAAAGRTTAAAAAAAADAARVLWYTSHQRLLPQTGT